jgi:hypothetical protein
VWLKGVVAHPASSKAVSGYSNVLVSSRMAFECEMTGSRGQGSREWQKVL